MLFNHILVPFDGSDLSIKSLEKAMEIAKLSPTSKITVIHVVQLPVKRVPDALYNQVKKMILDEGAEVISKAEKILEGFPNEYKCSVIEGSPIHTILEEAENLECDLIIMGKRGLSGLKEFLGSVSHYVVQNTKIPVLLMK